MAFHTWAQVNNLSTLVSIENVSDKMKAMI